jgi:hypothetical protein
VKSPFFSKAVEHARYVEARDTVLQLLRTSPGGKTVVLVGPTQAGKSLVFEYIMEQLAGDFHLADTSQIPLVGITVATSQDGRISPKHLNLKLLKALDHPVWEHVGAFDEYKHYRPSRNRDESSMRDAVEFAIKARATRYMAFDEAHHLTYSKNKEVRSNVLHSVKCLAAIEGTLFLCGGYELVYRGLFDAAHFLGRTIILDFGSYGENASDFSQWESILKSFSLRIPSSPKHLLLAEAQTLLNVTNGSFGLLEKILWMANSLARGGPLTERGLRAAFPANKEREAIKRDIQAGCEALSRRDNVVRIAPPSKKPKPKPFTRKPRRDIPSKAEIARD